MVVHRKRYSQKGATLGKKLEGTSAYTYPFPPSPEHSGRTSSNVFGPTLKKSMPCEDTPHNSDYQVKQGKVGRGMKFGDPSISSTSGRNECIHDRPLSFTTPGNDIRPEFTYKPRSEIGPSTHPHKPLPSSIKGKKVITRGSLPFAKSCAAYSTHLDITCTLLP